MKILYRQPETDDTPFDALGIEGCCLKQMSIERDFKRITTRMHRHNGFEAHILESGHQIYELNGVLHTVRAGEILLIPPETEHRAVTVAPATRKFSMTFSAAKASPAASVDRCFYGKQTAQMPERIAAVLAERERGRITSPLLVAGAVFELLVAVLRLCGMNETQARNEGVEEDLRLAMAKRYIEDNAEKPIKVGEVAAYCYLSERQLSRLFAAEEKTPAEYIRDQRIKLAQRLVREGNLSFKEISAYMGFSGEQYFNSFFKRLTGMPPGEYKKMNQ